MVFFCFIIIIIIIILLSSLLYYYYFLKLDFIAIMKREYNKENKRKTQAEKQITYNLSGSL